MIRVLTKVLIKEYYRQNAAFFLLICMLTFGFMSGTEHKALAGFFISSPITMLIPIVIWALYTLKVIHFNTVSLQRPQNSFILHLSLFPKEKQFLYATYIIFIQEIPMVLYAIFLSILSFQFDLNLSLLLASGISLLLVLTGALTLQSSWNSIVPETAVFTITNLFNQTYTRSLVQVYIEHLFRHDAFIILGTKAFTLLLLFGVANVYQGETYDARLMAIAVTFAFTAHLPLVQLTHYFENTLLMFLRNLPQLQIKRLTTVYITFLILALPEITFILKYLPDSLNAWDALQLVLFGLSLNMLLYSLQYVSSFAGKENKLIFTLPLLFFFLIMFKIPLLIFSFLTISVAILVYRFSYYRFEADFKNG